MGKPLLSDKEIGLLTAIIGLVPAIGRFIAALAGGSPEARRVADVLTRPGASRKVEQELRAQQKP